MMMHGLRCGSENVRKLLRIPTAWTSYDHGAQDAMDWFIGCAARCHRALARETEGFDQPSEAPIQVTPCVHQRELRESSPEHRPDSVLRGTSTCSPGSEVRKEFQSIMP